MSHDKYDYSLFDRPEVMVFLFHPRAETYGSGEGYEFIKIPVKGASIGGRLYASGKDLPTVLFFHGNGEIVADYDEFGDIYGQMGANFMPVDYRGYGKSTGMPSVGAMMNDCHEIYRYAKELLADKGVTGPLVVMGRSLGSASALELASHYRDEIKGLIIESGFAYAVPLLELLGVEVERLGIKEESGLNNADKIRDYTGPLLVIHAEHDHIIPFSDGETLFANSPSKNKKFLEIKKANHNTIFQYGLNEYVQAVARFLHALQE